MGVKGDGFRGSLKEFRDGYDLIFVPKCNDCGKVFEDGDEWVPDKKGNKYCIKCSNTEMDLE